MQSEPAIGHPTDDEHAVPDQAGSERSATSGQRPAAKVPSLEDVYRQHGQFVWRNLLRLGVPQSAVEDAVHDTFLVLARRLGEFEHRSSLKTWLFAIVYNVARGYRRDIARSIDRQAPLSEVAEPHADASGPEILSDTTRQLHHLLGKLDEDKRVAFVMAELEGMTALEIAAVLRVKVPTVYSRIRLARECLEREVRQLADPDPTASRSAARGSRT